MIYQNEFPAVYVMPPELVKLHEEFPKLKDVSWHNDSMPHSEILLRKSDEIYAEIWWDTERQEDSEWANAVNWRRFAIHLRKNDMYGKPVRLCWDNDVRELIRAFRHLLLVFEE